MRLFVTGGKAQWESEHALASRTIYFPIVEHYNTLCTLNKIDYGI